jgi:hypothetical protein
VSRFLTIALVAGIGVLACAALVDALRNGGPPDPVARDETRADPGDGAGEEELAAAGVAGRLLYTDPEDCTLHALELPALRRVEAPSWETCAFTVGPAGAVASEGTVFERRRGLLAEEFGGLVQVVGEQGSGGRRFANARAAAFRPDGTLTLVRRGQLVALTSCPGRRPELPALGRCRSVLTTEKELTSRARLSVDPRPLRLALETVRWLADSTFVALVDAGAADALLGVRLGGRQALVDVWFEDDSLSGLDLDPRGRFVSVVTATGELAVFDRGGTLLGLRGMRVRASAWSPDGRWVALLDGNGVLFVDTSNGEGVGPVPLFARDLGRG